MSEFNYESIPPGYYDQVYKLESGVQSKWHHLKFRFFSDHIRSTDFILDIGCGPGTFLANLNNFHRGIGVDISEAQIEYAKTHYQDTKRTFVCFDGDRLPYEDCCFDVVTLVEVIEHLTPETVAKLYSEAFRTLKPDGRLYVSTPNYASLWPLLEKAVNAKADVTYEEQHINLFQRGRLKNEIENCGFTQTKVRAYQFLAPFLAAISWPLSDTIYKMDRGIFSSRIGFLLFAEARKPN